MMDNSCDWITEVYDPAGCAFGLKISKKLHSEQSEHQKIDIVETMEFGNTMLLNNCIALSDKNHFIYHEMMVHPAMLTHPAVRDVVIIGGGDCGALSEVLRHDAVRSVVQAAPDERVTRLSEEYFPLLCASNNDPRAELFFGDGADWVKNADEESADLVIIDSIGSSSDTEDFFNTPFYRGCLRMLRPGGIIIQQSQSPLLDLSLMTSMRSKLFESGFRSCQPLLFPLATFPSGWWSATMARKDADIHGFRERGAANLDFETRYYNAEIHKSSLALPQFMVEHFQSTKTGN